MEQHPRRDAAAPSAGVISIHVDDLATGFAEKAADEFVDGLAARCDATPAAGYRDIVAAWLRGEPLPGGPLAEHRYAAAWFSGLTDVQRRDWLRLYYMDFTGCRLQSTHFGGQSEQTAQTGQYGLPGQGAGGTSTGPEPRSGPAPQAPGSPPPPGAGSSPAPWRLPFAEGGTPPSPRG